MADKIHFDLVSPERMLLSEDVDMVTLPGSEGDFGVYAGHAPVISTLRPGVIDVKGGESADLRLFVRGGFVEVNPAKIVVLAEEAATYIEAINAHADTVTEQERGEAAVIIAAAKQVAIEVGLDIGSRIYEVTGARATANSVGLDIYWRNIRTHSLHDPVAHKRAEVGRFFLLGEIPEPTWYT